MSKAKKPMIRGDYRARYEAAMAKWHKAEAAIKTLKAEREALTATIAQLQEEVQLLRAMR